MNTASVLFLAMATYGDPALTSPQTPAGEPIPARFTWGDIDADGFPDALTWLPGGETRLLRNLTNGQFEDITSASGIDQLGPIERALWSDFDGDGSLDLFAISATGGCHLMLQGSPGTFDSQIENSDLWNTLAPVECYALDWDTDGAIDLCLVMETENVLLHNLGRARFERLALELPSGPLLLPDRAGPRPHGSLLDEPDESAGALPAPGSGGAGPDPAENLIGAPVTSALPPGDPFDLNLGCVESMQDASNPANCIVASSVPTLGTLCPLSEDFYINFVTGNVGIGTLAPNSPLTVEGDVRTSGKLISTILGEAPLQVSSSVVVPFLNADYLDGKTSAVFSQFGASVDTPELTDGAVTTAKLGVAAVTSDKLSNGSITLSKIFGDSVDSARIVNSSIVDADISPTAAISGSKVNPNFLLQDVRTDGYFDAAYGSDVDPSITFSSGEATGLSSPYLNYLSLLTDGTALMNLTADGRVLVGPQVGPLRTRLFSRISETPIGTQVASAVYGHADALTGIATGVNGLSDSTSGIGVKGHASAATGDTAGVHGSSISPGGIGVSGSNIGSDGVGVHGTGTEYGVYGFAPYSGATGVQGQGHSATGTAHGVIGYVTAGSGYGVWGASNSGSYAVFASGDLAASGTKSFVQPHPADASTQIRFVCLEGNESGTYFRGSGSLTNGMALIEVPEEFRNVSEADELTVQVTALGPAALWVESKSLDSIVVRGNADVEFDYFVNGIRRGFKDIELVASNRAFVPTEVGEDFSGRYPDGLLDVLVENGTLNADYTANAATAQRLGWPLSPQGTAADEFASHQRAARPLAEEPELATPGRRRTVSDRE